MFQVLLRCLKMAIVVVPLYAIYTGTAPESVLIDSLPEIPNLKHLDFSTLRSEYCFLGSMSITIQAPFKLIALEPQLRVADLIGFKQYTAGMLNFWQTFLRMLHFEVSYGSLQSRSLSWNKMGGVVQENQDYKSARTSTIELAAKFSRFKFVIPNFSMNYFGCLIMKPFISLHQPSNMHSYL